MGYLDAIEENIYAHRKKLLFFINRINVLREERGVPASAIDVLDVGCGNGTAVTLPVGEQGYSVLGIDFHQPSIDYARQVNTLENVRFIHQAAESFPDEHEFDVVLFSDILEHVYEPQALLKNARAVLKPGGLVLVSIPNGYGPFEIESYLNRIGVVPLLLFVPRLLKQMLGKKKRVNAAEIPYNSESGHVQFFTMRRFKTMLHEVGLEITAMSKGGFLCGPLSDVFLSRLPLLVKWNVAIAGHLPYALCSAWHFECKVGSGKAAAMGERHPSKVTVSER